MRTEPLIVLGERGRLPQLSLLGCTIFEDRIEAKGFILHAPLKRGRTLARLRKVGQEWTVPRGALLARVPRLTDSQVSLHRGLTLTLARRGR